jgi:uncharacterized phiE125 gp8 family phage protein
MILIQTTAPPAEPITLDELKDYLRIDTTTHDDQLTTLITTCRLWVENVIHRALVEQTWKYYLDAWPSDGKDYFEIPLPPLQSITAIKYTISTGAKETWHEDYYEVDIDSEPGRIILAYDATWPTDTLHPKNPIEVEFVCGYEKDETASPDDYAANIPDAIKHAIMLHAEILYDRPPETNIKVLCDRRDSLLASYKVWSF